MLVDATAAEAAAIVRAMREVATAGGTEPLTDADRTAIRAVHHYVFRGQDELDVDALEPITPADLAASVADQRVRDHAVGFLAVMATVDGTIDKAKIGVVERFASALGSTADEVHQLSEAAAGHLSWVLADMARQNALSITGHELKGDFGAWLQPYTAAPGPDLAARYEALAGSSAGSFGAAFHAFYKANGFKFAGTPGTPNERFATPHDSTHVLSGYSTTPQGELLVSTFTAGMHRQEPVSGHILPVIFSWHLGVVVVQFAGRFTGALEPRRFWVAWTRGSALVADVFDPAWDFWASVERPLDDLREQYQVPPLDPSDAADDHPPAWYRPTA